MYITQTRNKKKGARDARGAPLFFLLHARLRVCLVQKTKMRDIFNRFIRDQTHRVIFRCDDIWG